MVLKQSEKKNLTNENILYKSMFVKSKGKKRRQHMVLETGYWLIGKQGEGGPFWDLTMFSTCRFLVCILC